MTLKVKSNADTIEIIDSKNVLRPSIKSMLRLYGFRQRGEGLVAEVHGRWEAVLDVTALLTRLDIALEYDEHTAEVVRRANLATSELKAGQDIGAEIKNGILTQAQTSEFLEFIEYGLERPLLLHQVKAALHMLNVAHSANFSTPGAGKTSVVLAVYEFLRHKERVNSLFVVGPRSCFLPWQSEFNATLGRLPAVEVMAGGEIPERHSKYYARTPQPKELYLTTYQTLSRDSKHVQYLLREPGHHAFFVVDEAHYMKQDGGVWANAVTETSRFAVKRCIMTGTPFPRSYGDGISQFNILYPDARIFDSATKTRIRNASEAGQHQLAKGMLEPRIRNLFYRVRKSELGLSDPVFLRPIEVEMNPIERELYDCIDSRIADLASSLDDCDLATSLNLQRGRQIRRRQAVSYASLLLSAINNYSENLIDPENSFLVSKIRHYSDLETPAKMETLGEMLRHHNSVGEKVVVWANFIGTLQRIRQECKRWGLRSEIVYGGTPTDETSVEEETREKIIEAFKDRNTGLDILIANPAACAESVSLHRTCSNAIYYDLSYNCAEYLQSLDRIHRVGGSEDKESFYHFLQYRDTFEAQILDNLNGKTARMLEVIDQEFPLAGDEWPGLDFTLDGHT
ncbi:MAG: DEAD/DEAH box helicase [bacterium]|nr:DEAD/DEAH box helicase [bacterium]